MVSEIECGILAILDTQRYILTHPMIYLQR